MFNNPVNLIDPEGFRGQAFQKFFEGLAKAGKAALEEFNKQTPAKEFVEKMVEEFAQDQFADQQEMQNEFMRRFLEAQKQSAENARMKDSNFADPCRDGIMCNKEELEKAVKDKFNCE